MVRLYLEELGPGATQCNAMCQVTLYLVAWIMIEETDSRAEDEVVSQSHVVGKGASMSKDSSSQMLKLIHYVRGVSETAIFDD